MASIDTYNSKNRERNIAMLRSFLDGKSMSEIGRRYNGGKAYSWDSGKRVTNQVEHLSQTSVRIAINSVVCHLFDKPLYVQDNSYYPRYHTVINFPFSASEIRGMKVKILRMLNGEDVIVRPAKQPSVVKSKVLTKKVINVGITAEMLDDLKSIRRRILEHSEPGIDLDVFTLNHIIEKCEPKFKL